MGYRTTIILNNDHLELLQTTPSIGKQIHEAVTSYSGYGTTSFGQLGQVVEQSHADISKLILLGPNGSFEMEDLASICGRHKTPLLCMLESAANDIGYTLVKIKF